MLGECSLSTHTAPVLFPRAELLALSIKGNVLSASAAIGPGEQDSSGSLSSRSDWLQQASVKGVGTRDRNLSTPPKNSSSLQRFYRNHRSSRAGGRQTGSDVKRVTCRDRSSMRMRRDQEKIRFVI